jgi:hypothetical protein
MNQREIPPGICPHIIQEGLNKPIEFYEGKLIVNKDDLSFEVDGKIELVWFPFASLRFELKGTGELQNNEFNQLHRGDKIDLIILGQENSVLEGKITYTSKSSVIKGEIVDTKTDENKQGERQASYAKFFIPNFRYIIGRPIRYQRQDSGFSDGNRLSLSAKGWNITLDALSNIDQLQTDLINSSGFAITHYGILQKNDGSLFDYQESKEIVDALKWYLSFVRGSFINPYALIGFNADHNEVWKGWKGWESSRMFPYHNNISWISKLDKKIFEEPFKGFADLYFDPEWSDSLKQIIHIYLESQHPAMSLEGAIILLQSALELLSYEILVEKNRVFTKTQVEKNRVLTKTQFEKLRMRGECIKLLFDQLKIPLEISEHLEDLHRQAIHRQAKGENWLAPDAIRQMRNCIVHPSKKNRIKLKNHSQEAYEVLRLCQWSLELCILKLCNYNGVYTNRLKRTQYQGDVDSVPWDS